MSLEDQLLKASLLCELKPGGASAHRFQLFFVTNNDIGSRSHQSDLQRALETGVNTKKYWENWPNRWSGSYRITAAGYATAVQIFGVLEPRYRPVQKQNVDFDVTGAVEGVRVLLETRGAQTRVSLDGVSFRSAKEACRALQAKTRRKLPTQGDSAVRVLYNLAIDEGFTMQWCGPK
ncbi:MAG: hypothetical protein ABSB22_13665 [Thermodesulfobacteriota bacterium]|jgi:hypothetical protein